MTRREKIKEEARKVFPNINLETAAAWAGFVHGAVWADANPKEVICIDDRAELDLLKRQLAIAVSALKSGVGYEPLGGGTLEPYRFSEALAKIREMK